MTTAQLGTALSGLGNLVGGKAANLTTLNNAGFFTAITQLRFQTAKVVRRSTSQLVTVPEKFDLAVTETYPYIVDVTNYLGVNDSVAIVSPILTLLSTGKVVQAPWFAGPIIQGNIVTIPINCGYLRFGQDYQIAVNFTASSTKRATYLSTFSLVS
jgi:hypothetical protein